MPDTPVIGESVAAADGVHHSRITVAFDYPVHFTTGLFHPDNPLLSQVVGRREPQRRHRLLVAIDSGVERARPDLAARIAAYGARHGGKLEIVCPPLGVEGGEGCKKDSRHLQALLAALHRHHIDRQSFVLAVGGGAVLDLVGFAAAITHRGLRLIRVPTTVLAQNDAGIGVKNAVNAFGCKNFLGTFAPPWAVLNDLDFLETLERRDRIAGLAEAVKVALIRDAGFFRWLEDEAEALVGFERPATAAMIRRCAVLHLRHIAESGDPFECGSARPLDYGHWAAHKLEGLSEHTIRHGEAVAFGVALDTCYAALSGRLAAGEAERVCRLLERLGFRLWHPTADRVDAAGRPLLLQGLDEFREHLGGELTIGLLSEIGDARDVNSLDEALIRRCLADLRQRDATAGSGPQPGSER
ncbi:MAG: 3-dehydroquinate synthase [Rhodospirillales bacterium]